MILRRRFSDVVDRQLRLFEEEHAGLLADCTAAERAYDRAPREEAEGRYGDYLDLVETGSEILAGLRNAYAATLAHDDAQAYAAAFNRGVVKRLPSLALAIEDY